MKTCTRCGESKPLVEFNDRGKIKHSWCKKCQRQYDKDWYNDPSRRDKCAEKRRLANAAVRERNRSFVHEYLLAHPCECGEDRPPALEFHHLDPSTKILDVSIMMQRGHSLRRISEEIAKCKVICANCHRVLHFEEKRRGG